MVHGGVEAGPNAVLSFKREGYRKTDFDAREAWDTLSYRGFWRLARKYWRTGAGEFYRSFSKAAFVRALQRLLPDLRMDDLHPSGAGVRAQAIDPSGALVDDFSHPGARRHHPRAQRAVARRHRVAADRPRHRRGGAPTLRLRETWTPRPDHQCRCVEERALRLPPCSPARR